MDWKVRLALSRLSGLFGLSQSVGTLSHPFMDFQPRLALLGCEVPHLLEHVGDLLRRASLCLDCHELCPLRAQVHSYAHCLQERSSWTSPSFCTTSSSFAPWPSTGSKMPIVCAGLGRGLQCSPVPRTLALQVELLHVCFEVSFCFGSV